MRKLINFNSNWAFIKGTDVPPEKLPNSPVLVNLPHTWNAADGQDGGNDYYRSSCCYLKSFSLNDLPCGDMHYLEIKGANSSAAVFLNGQELARHHGGYSTWRVNLTPAMQEENLLAITVDNSPCDNVYPQHADFTFYGGLYRDVNIISVNRSHFDLDYHGAPGIAVTPKIEGSNAAVEIEVFITNKKPEQSLNYKIIDKALQPVACEQSTTSACVTLNIPDVHLWQGRKDPYLYTAVVELTENGEVIDSVFARFGCRTFKIDAEKGFFLNGEHYPLHGVSRHQDWHGLGNALLPEHHKTDIQLICELGANTVRLAHYQHDSSFYDLCDEAGLIVWAEIPYISSHLSLGTANTVSQMTELIIQNYNHPSIAFWGLSNEITMAGASTNEILENHRILNSLAHSLDPTRLTTIAAVSMCDMDDPYLRIPDVIAYNHYFGWYGGEPNMNGPWFDEFHKKHPDIPIGMSEYGCEALNWHSSQPVQGDYTEEYQAYYHEELIKQLFEREYIWGTYVWNMFDFGADARCEGGENGQNHKGLVTFDRKYKKDAFYAYKAWLSDEKFVHICGKRYIDRVEAVTRVTVYSSLDTVELSANGKSLGKQKSTNHFFYFEVPNKGETRLVAVAEGCRDESVIRKVDSFNEDYRLQEKGAVLNWFDVTAPEGYYSLNDKLSEIMKSDEGREVFHTVTKQITEAMKSGTGAAAAMGDAVNQSEGMMKMMGSFTLLRLTSMLGMMDVTFTKEQLLELNSQLNKIKKYP